MVSYHYYPPVPSNGTSTLSAHKDGLGVSSKIAAIVVGLESYQVFEWSCGKLLHMFMEMLALHIPDGFLTPRVCILGWFLAIFVQYFVMKAYVPDAQVLWAAFALGVAALGVALPSSPGAIGIYEGSFVAALAVVGVSHAPALAYALTTHVMYYLVTGIFGSYALVKEDESLTNLFRTIRKQGAQ